MEEKDLLEYSQDVLRAEKTLEVRYEGYYERLAEQQDLSEEERAILHSDITREDLYTMLYRYAGSPAVSGDLSGYPDGSTVSDYAQSAMAWAVETGLCTGTGAGTLDPQGDASRAQVATILMRFMTL